MIFDLLVPPQGGGAKKMCRCTPHSCEQLAHQIKKRIVAFPCVETSTGPGGFMICVFIIWRNSRRLNRKWFYGEAGNRTCDPWFTRHSAYPLQHGAKFGWISSNDLEGDSVTDGRRRLQFLAHLSLKTSCSIGKTPCGISLSHSHDLLIPSTWLQIITI